MKSTEEELIHAVGMLIAIALVLLASSVIAGAWIGFIAGIAMRVAGWIA